MYRVFHRSDAVIAATEDHTVPPRDETIEISIKLDSKGEELRGEPKLPPNGFRNWKEETSIQ